MGVELASDSEDECQAKCNELGPDCAGFLRMTSGLDKGKCLFKKAGIKDGSNGKTSDNSTCFEKEDPRDPLVKKYVALNLWVLKQVNIEINWICQAGFPSTREENRVEAFRHVVETYTDRLQCQEGDIPCPGGHPIGQKPMCKCLVPPRPRKEDEEEKKSTKCPAQCATCQEGGAEDGGIPLANGKCTAHCSRFGYCGTTSAYMNRGTDCTTCTSSGNTQSKKKLRRIRKKERKKKKEKRIRKKERRKKKKKDRKDKRMRRKEDVKKARDETEQRFNTLETRINEQHAELSKLRSEIEAFKKGDGMKPEGKG